MGLQEMLILCGWPLAIYGMVLFFLFGPGAFAAALYLVGLIGVSLDVAIVQAALPQGIVLFVFAKEYNVHADILSTVPLEEELHGRCPQAAEIGFCCQPQICQPSCLAPILMWSRSNPNSLEYVFFFGPNGCSLTCAPQDWHCCCGAFVSCLSLTAVDPTLNRAFELRTLTTRSRCQPIIGKYAEELMATAKAHPGTIGKRLASIHVENVEYNRQALRELLFTAPDVAQCLSRVILFEETLYQKTQDGKPFVEALKEEGVLPGVKVDKRHCGDIGITEPSELATQLNAQGLARYAIICQENGLVSIVEPEVLTDGNHSIEKCAAVTETLQRTVPPAVPGIVFLSGGKKENVDAAQKALHVRAKANSEATLRKYYGTGNQEATATRKESLHVKDYNY
ncbi:unnamed protein product [Sphagnum balticum]